MDKKILNSIIQDPYKYANNIKVEDLVTILKQLAFHYYNTGEALVSDEVYDILKDVLEKRDPTNEFLTLVGAPISKDKVKLPYYMPSLDKIKPVTEELEKWVKKYKGPYVLSDKLDGVSGLVYKNKKGKMQLFTRGDGQEGQDISYLIPHVLSKNIKFNKLPKEAAIRGEIIISKDNFKKIKNDFKNGRNAVAGLVNSKKYSKEVANVTEFIAYAVIAPEMNQISQMKTIEEWEFPCVNYIVKKNLSNKMLSEYLVKRRNEGACEIDGIVVIDSSKSYKTTIKNPEHGFAFKQILTDQIAEVKVLDVEWDASMHGYLKPRVRIEPVSLTGVEIEYATAFNAKFVKDNNLGPGAVIKLVRSGDVIPHILEVLKSSASGKPKMPDVPYKWNKTGIDIIVKDIHGSMQDRIVAKRISNFFKVMNVKYISEGIVTKLVDSDYKTVIDILKADKDKLAEIEGIGAKIITKIFNNIDAAFKKTSLAQLMAASTIFGRGFGVKRTKLITNKYPDIMKKNWDKKTMISKIEEIEGFDTITASQFSNNFAKFKKFYKKLEDTVDLSHLKKIPKKKKKDNKFAGQKIVFTGFRDKELEKLIEDQGGNIKGTVSKNTSAVVYSDKSTSKYKKAIDLGVPTYTLEEFKKKYKLN